MIFLVSPRLAFLISAQIFIRLVWLIVMSKTKDTGYLFAKMSSAEENGIGHIIVGEQKEAKSPLPPTRTFHFDENGNVSEKQPVRKWISDNVMLLVTLTGVLVGVVTGKSNFLDRVREKKKTEESGEMKLS